MPVSPARSTAFDILLRVEREGSYASELLHSSAYERLSRADHALTTELVMGVLRWRSRLDDEISTASSHPLRKLDIEILTALRLALYQLRWLDRIPQHAALDESVELVKRARKRSAVPFVNAVLRKLSVSGKSFPETAQEGASAEELARILAHPLWLVERWIKEYGFSAARTICEHNQSIPTTAIRVRNAESLSELQQEAGITLSPGCLLASARRISKGDVTKTKPYHRQQIVIQDEGSQIIAALIGRSAPERDLPARIRILDCCAAPGGKTLAIADRNPGAPILALELHPHRARLLQKLIGPSHSPAQISVVTGDARQLPISCMFDRILVDAPCSGTGTLAHNPEIKWHLSPGDLQDLHTRQRAILQSALARLAPGGRLVYSTCSLEKEENENVIEELLAKDKAFRLLACGAEIDRLKSEGELTWPDPSSLARGPYLRTIPAIHPCDGFFAAILEKT